MVIRNDQMDAFDQETTRRFARRVAAHMREEHAAAVEDIPDEELERRCAAAVARGRAFGLTLEGPLTAFAALTFLVAPDYYECDRIKRFLDDQSLAPDDRMDRLLREATVKDWAEAMKE
jgi:hypothetical protein